MRPALFLPAALLLLGCQRQPDPQLARLHAQLTTQQDTLRQLRRALASQQDSVRLARLRLAATQERLEETAQLANYIEQGETGQPPRRRSRPASIPAGTLYSKPAVVTLPDAEMAEILSIADSSTTHEAKDYAARAYLVCNGPADATIDECNCSHYVYLALGTYDLPNEYKLFRLGPFFEADFAGWSKGPVQNQDEESNQLTLRIRHDMKGRQQTDAFRISWQGVQRL